MVNKVGDQKYYLIISLITGLMILTISIYWIFGEFFDEDEIDWEVCRQSILLRASLPDVDLKSLKTDAKGAFPLKCKTEVVNINDLDTPEELYSKISNAVAEGWYMYGEGKLDFIHRSLTETQTVCMAFARIHYDEKAVNKFSRGNWNMFLANRGYIDPFVEGFQDYYRSNKVPNSDGVYDEYLPLYVNTPTQSGNFIVDWSHVKFNPDDGDYLLVYRMNKKSGFSGSAPFRFVSGLASKFKDDGDGIIWEEYKTIALASVDDLDVLECDKFLTVPA